MNSRKRYDLGYRQKKSGSENIFQSGGPFEVACIIAVLKFVLSTLHRFKYTGFSKQINEISPLKTVATQPVEKVNAARRLLINSNRHEKKQEVGTS